MTDWTERAACRDWPTPDDFFPVRGAPTAAIKSLCAACDVRFDCLEWAIKHERYGTWAATDEETRDALRKRKGIPLEPVGWMERDRRVDPPDMQPCGTAAAARRHERKGEPKCEPCQIAAREANRKSQAKRQQKRETA